MKSGFHRVYIGFGANLGDPLDTYGKAKVLLQSRLGPIVKESWIYESTALTLSGSESQTNYVNAALLLETDRSPREILAELLAIELVFKRDRLGLERWAPRPIDLDILFIDDLVVKESRLTVPHPELHKRDFVLCPLLDIAPNLVHPELGETIASLENSLVARGYGRFIVRRFQYEGETGLAEPLLAS
jgi:2-amino-4-hydroxy-6-hydroxymethyldihydropteridine diphosphokinase